MMSYLDPNIDLNQLGQNARSAARLLAIAPTEQKNAALHAIASRLSQESAAVLDANRDDVASGQANGLSAALIDRLLLNPARLEAIAADLRRVAELPDPVGETFEQRTLPNGLQVRKVRHPLGVIGVIYESRPNVTIDVTGLALKSGNAAILRGGSETLVSNRTLVRLIHAALESVGLPSEVIQFIDNPDRALVYELLQLYDYIDMIIPRGGAGLHRFCRENSRIPVITGGIGICHLFVDESADLAASLEVVRNAKVQRPTVCNALDTLLVHRSVAASFLPQVVAHLIPDGVSFRADPSAWPFVAGQPAVTPAGADDFDTEWLSLVLGLKVVSGLDEAVEHIARHSTEHSDGILTANPEHASQFIRRVDSSVVFVNASTRFNDGAQLGLGAEVAVSTQRLHARGPMALRELTAFKWVVEGEYQVRK